MNVTCPFKEAAYDWVTSCDEYAGTAGAVNTIVAASGGFRGFNTDGLGLVRDLTINLGCVLDDKRVLILGAGGAVRGILGPLLGAGPRALVVANRTLSRARNAHRALRRPAPGGVAGRHAHRNRSTSSSMERLPDWRARYPMYRMKRSLVASSTTWCMGATHRGSALGPSHTARPGRSMDSACWSNRRQKRFDCSTAFVPTAPWCCADCARPVCESREVHRRRGVPGVWRDRQNRPRRARRGARAALRRLPSRRVDCWSRRAPLMPSQKAATC